jgi:hypothetical protein
MNFRSNFLFLCVPQWRWHVFSCVSKIVVKLLIINSLIIKLSIIYSLIIYSELEQKNLVH